MNLIQDSNVAKCDAENCLHIVTYMQQLRMKKNMKTVRSAFKQKHDNYDLESIFTLRKNEQELRQDSIAALIKQDHFYFVHI